MYPSKVFITIFLGLAAIGVAPTANGGSSTSLPQIFGSQLDFSSTRDWGSLGGGFQVFMPLGTPTLTQDATSTVYVGLFSKANYNDCVAGNGGNTHFAEYADSGYTQLLNGYVVPFNGVFYGSPATPAQSYQLPQGYIGKFAVEVASLRFVAGHYYAFTNWSCGDVSRTMDFGANASGTPYFVFSNDLTTALAGSTAGTLSVKTNPGGSGGFSSSSVQSHDIAITVDDSPNRVLVCAIDQTQPNTDPTSLTWNSSQHITKVNDVVASTGLFKVSFWVLIAPDVGDHTVHFEYADFAETSVSCASFHNADQVNGYRGFTAFTGTTNHPMLAIPNSTSSDFVMDSLGYGHNITNSDNLTIIHKDNFLQHFSAATAYGQASQGTTTIGYRGESYPPVAYAAIIIPAAFVPPPPPPPSITLIFPTAGFQGQTIDTFTVTGSAFQQGTTLAFSGTGVTAESVTVPDPAHIVARINIINGALTGPRDVIVTNPDSHAATLGGGFTVNRGHSNVAFFPGFEGSRLYTQSSTGGERRLWFTNPFAGDANSNVCALRPLDDGSGSSQSGISEIYTKDIADFIGGLPLADLDLAAADVYGTFTAFMNGLQPGVIKQWRPFPYDWRLDVDRIATDGITLGDGGLVTPPLIDLVAAMEDLARDSYTGKVTIITHSNGALLAKALLRVLKASGKAGVVDLIIMVAPPHLGTPSGMAALLHGDGQDLLGVSKCAAREAAERMPGAYNLLPSQAYFDRVSDPVIEFDRVNTITLAKLLALRSNYPTDINSYPDFRRFMLGEFGARSEPVPGNTCPGPTDCNTSEPNVLLETPLFNAAEVFHSQTDALSDTWRPAGLEVIQVVGYGLDNTVRGIIYTSDFDCSNGPCLEVLEHKLLLADGDATVVVPSANALPIQTFYFNLFAYNNRQGSDGNREHHNMMGAVIDQTNPQPSPIWVLIRRLLDGERQLTVPPYIGTAPLESGIDSLLVTIASPVALHAFDAAGRHTGPAPNRNRSLAEAVSLEQQIPGSVINSAGHRVYLSLPATQQYRIELQGQAVGTFSLRLEELIDHRPTSKLEYIDLPVSNVTRGYLALQHVATSSNLQLDIDGDGVIDFVVSPGTRPNSAASLEIMMAIIKTLGLPAGIVTSLNSKLASAGAALRRGNRQAGIGILEAFQNEVRAQSNKTISAANANRLIGIVNKLLLSL